MIDGRWEAVRDVDLPVPEIENANSAPDPSGIEPAQLFHTGESWLVAGTYLGRATIWRSRDLDSWTVVYHEGPTNRDEPNRWMHSVTNLVEMEDTLVVGGTGAETQADEERGRAFLFVSDDDGRSWHSIENPVLSESNRRLSSMAASADTLVVQLVTEDPEEPRPIPLKTRDFKTWEPIELPDAGPEPWAAWATTREGTLVALAGPSEGDTTSRLWWSNDGAESFEQAELNEPLRQIQVLSDGVLAIPEAELLCCAQSHFLSPHPGQVWYNPLGEWTLTEPDLGQWGDGFTGLHPTAFDDETGRNYAVASRLLRADPHHCYVDVTTCQELELALVTSIDGRTWLDVEWPGPTTERIQLETANSGELIVWWVELEEGPLRFRRWTGPDAPHNTDPPGYEPAEAPIPFFDGGTLKIGEEYRYAYALGVCGGMSINGISWEPDEELDTTGWPIQEGTAIDGPSEFAYGRVRLESSDEVSFIIEGEGVVATLHPRTEPPEHICA